MPLNLIWTVDHLFSVLTFLLTLLFISFVLRSKKPPGSTVAWLFFIVIIPYVGIPLYLLLTNRKLGFHREKEKAVIENTKAHPNQKLEILTTGEAAYEKNVELIASAQHSILLTTFILSNDMVGKSLIKLLTEKAKEGVSVNIILDAFGSNLIYRPSFKKLKKHGGNVINFNPILSSLFRYVNANTRNHRKLLVVDSSKALIGGMNIAEKYMGPTPDKERWIDLCMLIEGTAVKDVQHIFEQDWQFATNTPLTISAPRGKKNTGKSNLKIIASGPDVREDTLYDTYASLIFRAKERVWIATPYFVPDEILTKALELAAKRKVDVKLLMPKKSNHLLADMARGSYLRQLANAGCKISLTKEMVHAKVTIIDDHSLIGSANFDMRSLLLNYEISGLSTSPEVTDTLAQWFEQLFKKIQQDEFEVGYGRDLVEGVARVFGPLV